MASEALRLFDDLPEARAEGNGVAGCGAGIDAESVNKVYAKLDFAKKTAWPKFLSAYHKT